MLVRRVIRSLLSTQSFDKELRKVCDWNRLSGISSHSFRRTQLTELDRDGWSLREIQHISEHKSLQSLKEYLDVDKAVVVSKYRERMHLENDRNKQGQGFL